MLAFVALKYIVVGSTLMVLVTSSDVLVPARPSSLVASLPPTTEERETSSTKEQSPSPPKVKSPSSYVSPLVSRVQRKIPNVPRQVMLFEVLGNDVLASSNSQNDIPNTTTSQDMTKLVVSSYYTTQFFDLDPDNTQDKAWSDHVQGFSVIAISNDARFTVKVGDPLVEEAGQLQGGTVTPTIRTVLYAGETARITGNLPYDTRTIEASFSPDSAWVLIRSPSNALYLWTAVEASSEEQPIQTFEISLEATAAAIGNGIFAFVEGGHLLVHRLDTDRTLLLKTSLPNFGSVHKMAICGDRIGMIQGNRFTSYNLNNTIHSKDYMIDVNGTNVTSLAFHDTHLALIGPNDRLYVYDLNRPSQEKRTKEQLDGIVIGKHRQFVGVRDFDNTSFEALECDLVGNDQALFRMHRILLKPVDDENDTDMTFFLPPALWSVVGLYLPKPQVLHQITGDFDEWPEAEPTEIQSVMNTLIARTFRKKPSALTVDNNIAHFIMDQGTNPKDLTPHLIRLDSQSKIFRSIAAIPDGLVVSTIYPAADSHRFVLFGKDGAVYLSSTCKKMFYKVTDFKHNTNTRVYLHPFQPLTLIYNEDVLYLIGDHSEPPKKVELFSQKTQTPVPTVSAHFGYSMHALFVKKTHSHHFTYTDVLPDTQSQ